MIPLAALSRLNAHARGHEARYGQRDAIYSYKTLAAMGCAIDGTAALRFVKWTGKCTRCVDGRFSHWEWDDGYTVACRDCDGTGQRMLRFTETTLPGGHVWHHPWNGRTMPGHAIARAVGVAMLDSGEYVTGAGAPVVWDAPGEWRPLLPAAPLPLTDLVPLLNEVEDWVEARPDRPRGEPYWWTWDQAKRNLRNTGSTCLGAPTSGYALELGRAPDGCFVCGADESLAVVNFGRYSKLFHWSLPVCEQHRKSPFPTDPPPAAMITPDIRRWMDRHEAKEKGFQSHDEETPV